MLDILYLKQLSCQIQGAKQFNDRLGTSNVFVINPFSYDFLLLLCFGRLLVLKDKEKKPPKVLPSVGFLLGAFVIRI